MNRGAVLEWILQDAEANEDQYKEADGAQDGSYDALLRDLESLGKTEPPASLPATPEEAIPLLRAHYGDDVTPISRVLNHLFPKGYLFYRVSKLEEEIFRGFDFFSPVVPEFGFPFPRVGRTGFDRYLKVNSVLLDLFGEAYPDLEDAQARVSWSSGEWTPPGVRGRPEALLARDWPPGGSGTLRARGQ